MSHRAPPGGPVPKDLVAASATPLVLSILARGESYGYAIIQRVKELSGGRLEWTDGMLYPILHRLEEQGLIASSWRTSETGRKRSTTGSSTTAAPPSPITRQCNAVHATLGLAWGGGRV